MKQFKFLIFLFFTLILSYNVFAYSLIDNGSFEDDNFTLEYKVGLDCKEGWCGKYVQANFDRFLGQTIAGGYDGLKSFEIYNTNMSSSFNNNFIMFSQDYATGGQDINFVFRTSVCNLTYANSNQCYLNYGYVNSAGAYTNVGSTATGQNSTWVAYNYTIPDGNFAPALQYNAKIKSTGSIAPNKIMSYEIDNFERDLLNKPSYLIGFVNNNTLYSGYETEFSAEFLDEFGFPISTATCLIELEDSNYAMTYSSGEYTYAYEFASAGNYDAKFFCSSVGYLSATDSINFNITQLVSDTFLVSDLVNVSSYLINDSQRSIDFVQNDDIFSFALTSNLVDYEVDLTFLDNVSSQQYFVYTSDDGVNWVFNNTYTFGDSANFDNPLQKIPFSSILDKYTLEFVTETTDKVYFKFEKRVVGLFYETIKNNSDWVNFNEPNLFVDGIQRNWDFFQNSAFSNIYSYLKKPLPEMSSSDLSVGFELQFNAYSLTPQTIGVGVKYGDTEYLTDINVSTSVKRFSIPINLTDFDGQILFKSDLNATGNFYISNYALIPKSYFLDRINLLKENKSQLDTIVINGVSFQYLKEASRSNLDFSFIDMFDDLEYLRVESVIDGQVTNSKTILIDNLVSVGDKKYIYEDLTGFIIDLSGHSSYPSDLRNLIVKATLINNKNENVAQQSKTIKLIQYPYFPNDFVLNISNNNNKVGENPSFVMRLYQDLPESFIGFDVIIYSNDSSLENPEYQTRIFNENLNCSFFECSKRILIDDWAWESEKNYIVHFRALFNTEYPTFDSFASNRNISVPVVYKSFETARIFQVFERSDRTYRNDERIQLVLQLRNENLKSIIGETEAYLTLDLCNSADFNSACWREGSTKFYPKSKIFDVITGYNYFFFDQLFYTDSGEILYDGNYVKFNAHILDLSNTYDSENLPIVTLSDKCNSGYGENFNHGNFLMNYWNAFWSDRERELFGCQVVSSEKIPLDSSEAKRILIDSSHSVVSGQNHSIACLKVDNENFQNTLEQDLVCAVLWNRAEESIDSFNIMVGNNYSDYSVSGIDKQYLNFVIPSENIIFNDTFMLAQSLNAEYQTDSLDTIGEVLQKGFDKLFSGFANPLLVVPETFTRQGLITNVGFDINFSNAFDPNYVKGLFFFRIKGLKVINQHDYILYYPEIENLNPKYFIKYANANNIRLPNSKTRVDIYVNDLSNAQLFGEKIEALNVDSPLVIYEEPSKQIGVDGNFISKISILRFDMVSDMLSNNQTKTQRNFIPFVFSYVVPVKTGVFELIDDILYGEDAFGNPAGLLTNPVAFGFKNWFWVVILITFLLIGSLILKNLRSSGGGITIPVVTPFLENMQSNKVYKRGR